MKHYNKLVLVSKSKGITEDELIARSQNGYILIADYKYEEDGKSFFLDYHLFRDRSNGKNEYILTIEEGKDIDPYHDFCSKRDVTVSFKTVQEAISYLKENEYFNVSDWGYQRRSKF